MELSRITSLASLYGTSAIGNRIAVSGQKPLERLSQQADSTRVQLSAYGQVKSATAQVETTAQKLQDKQNLATADDAAKAVQGFADAVNNRLSLVRQQSTAGKTDDAYAGALAGDGRVKVLAGELRRNVEGPSGTDRDALQKIGISFAADGSVKVDSNALKAAYQSNSDQVKETLGQLGTAAANTSVRQLSASGPLNGAIDRLNEKLGNIEQQQADYQVLLEQSQTVWAQDSRANQAQILAQQAFSFSGVGAYSRMFFSY